jgi:hypothetical protein
MSRPRCASEGASIATRTGISWDNAQCFEAGDALNPAQRTHPAAELQNKIRSGRFFRELGILTGRRSGDFISLLAGPKFLAITTRKPTRAALCVSRRMVNNRAVTANLLPSFQSECLEGQKHRHLSPNNCSCACSDSGSVIHLFLGLRIPEIALEQVQGCVRATTQSILHAIIREQSV